MARLILPSLFLSQKKLAEDIHTKHLADGASSVLTAYLAQQGIAMPAVVTTATTALAFDTSSRLLHKQAENYSQQRDVLFDPLMDKLRGMVQFLKGFYRGNVQQLGDWGVTVDARGRITYPVEFLKRQELAVAFLAKHASFAAGTSPLQPYLTQHDLVPATLSTDATTALAKHNTFREAAIDAETATQSRDKAWNPVWAQIQGIGNFLMKLHTGSQKKLGDWGFVVDASPRAPRARVTTLKAGEQKTITSVLVGGMIENVGETDLHLYRGKTTVGTPMILVKGEATAILKGWSTITVVNPDTLKAGKVQALVTAP